MDEKNLYSTQTSSASTDGDDQQQQHLTETQINDAAHTLRHELDNLLDRFRLDTSIENVPELAHEVRLALEEEYLLLTSQYLPPVLERAVLLTYDDSKRLPIHLACDKNAPISILTSLVNADGRKESIRIPDKWGDLPLHTACSRHQKEAVKLLVDSDSSGETLRTRADNGSLPLHTAVRYKAPADVVELLLHGGNESTLFEEGFFGMLPLHTACRNGAAPDVLELLLQYDEAKETVMKEDNVGRLAIHLALLHSTDNQLAVLNVLLRGMLCGRMERKGLDNWKSDMKRLLKSMTEIHERDFTTRDKLDIICDAIRLFVEKVFVLELAVWRASCLRFDAKFQSMEQVLEHERSIAGKDSFDAHKYKVGQRVLSGADVIVHHVIPFVENEVVDDLVKQFKEY